MCSFRLIRMIISSEGDYLLTLGSDIIEVTPPSTGTAKERFWKCTMSNLRSEDIQNIAQSIIFPYLNTCNAVVLAMACWLYL